MLFVGPLTPTIGARDLGFHFCVTVEPTRVVVVDQMLRKISKKMSREQSDGEIGTAGTEGRNRGGVSPTSRGWPRTRPDTKGCTDRHGSSWSRDRHARSGTNTPTRATEWGRSFQSSLETPSTPSPGQGSPPPQAGAQPVIDRSVKNAVHAW